LYPLFATPSQLAELATLPAIRLADTPFPLLLVAHHAGESTGLLIARRGPIEKRVVLERGVPVDCRSNLAHETFSRFLAAHGRLSDEEANAALGRSVARGVLLGEILVSEGRMDASELQRLLQQCLARKLFDLFTWSDGEVRFDAGSFATAAALKVKVARLVLTGVERYVPQETIDRAIGPVAGSLFAAHPEAAARTEELRPTENERSLLAALARPRRIEELLPASSLTLSELSRAIWGLSLLELVIPADRLVTLARGVAAAPAPAPGPPAGGPPVVPSPFPGRREETVAAAAKLREQDAFDLLGVSPEAAPAEIRGRYFAFARRFAPWEFDAPELQSAAPAARELFAAGALAFARLSDSKEREALLAARSFRGALSGLEPAATFAALPVPETPAEPESPPVAPLRASSSFFRIETDLLDATLQYKKGRALKEAQRWAPALQQFAFAADCDPQNGAYRAEAAHCRFLLAPAGSGPKSLEELKEAQRIDPDAITPYLYAGEIAAQLGRYDEAESYLRAAARRLGPDDRRALDALRRLAKQRKK
jgi:tetratricopeptide (TPR) repeat protein